MSFRLYAMVVGGFMCAANVGHGLSWRNVDGHAAFTAGYRQDKIVTDIDIYSLDKEFVATDNLKGESIDIFQVGASGDLLFCDHWLAKGFVNVGNVNAGKYKEVSSVQGEATLFSDGNITDGNSYDTSVGLGYLFNCRNGISLGPIAGYSYSHLKIKMSKIQTNEVSDPVLAGLRYDMRWLGPWLGAEVMYDFRCYSFDVGYEYHWSHWHAQWELKGPSVQETAFSDKRKSNDAVGNVVFLNGLYRFCKCWVAGVGLKYQHWSASNGTVVPKSDSLVLEEIDKIPKATWRSYQIELSIGYLF